MDIRWSSTAYRVGVEAGKAEPEERRRWYLQNEYDADHMRSESTRFPAYLDEELRRYCLEAGVTRYTLIAYLLRAWMAAWQTYGRSLDADGTGSPFCDG